MAVGLQQTAEGPPASGLGVAGAEEARQQQAGNWNNAQAAGGAAAAAGGYAASAAGGGGGGGGHGGVNRGPPIGSAASLRQYRGDEEDSEMKEHPEEEKQPPPGVTVRHLRPFYVHQWLDVLDTQDSWLEAQVIALDPPAGSEAAAQGASPVAASAPSSSASAASASSSSPPPSLPSPSPAAAASASTPQRVLVHYKGFHSKYDEWLDVSSPSTRDCVSRLAPLHTHTVRPHPIVQPRPFRGVGDRLDCKDTIGSWHRATIVGLDPHHDQVRIQYDDWPEKFMEWIDVESYRLQHLGAFTQQTIQPLRQIQVQQQHRGGRSAQQPQRAGSAAVSASDLALFQASSDTELRFRLLLRNKLQYDIVDQKEDGNCLFRSVSHQVYGDARHHAMVREATMRYIEGEKGFFQNFIAGETFEEYIARMKLDGQWGDNVELQAMSEIYERPIEIYAYSHKPLKTFMSSAAASSSAPAGGVAAVAAAGAGAGAVAPVLAGGVRPPPPPIRLSYHFASHYNSVIHPVQHRAQYRLQPPPGRMEADAIDRAARLRVLVQEQQRAASLASASASSSSSSSSSSSPEIPGSMSLAHSRETFSSSQSRLAANPSGFDHAVAASLTELDRALAGDIAQAQSNSLREMDDQQMLDAICKQSERDELEQQIAAAAAADLAAAQAASAAAAASSSASASASASSSAAAAAHPVPAAKQSLEDEVLQRAMAASLAASPGAAPGLSEEAQLAQALQLSAAAAGGSAASSSASPISDDAAMQSALRASLGDSAQLPRAVQACMEFGFPLESCVQAFEVCGGGAAGVEHDVLVQRMMDYLCSS